ncbi:MAG: hypothetical protein K6F93_08010 [Lachnospiraceae bacterium]|nr:hypothetical protein [Lachnospiraceae bacterium]
MTGSEAHALAGWQKEGKPGNEAARASSGGRKKENPKMRLRELRRVTEK